MAVASASREKTELSQSMEPSPSSAVKPDAADSAVPETSSFADPSDRNGQSNPSIHQRRDIDTQSPASLKSEEYRKLFGLPPYEVLVQDFNCAFQDSILLQGHMYLFVHYICFYSNIFSFETKKVIHFDEVACVRKAKTAGIFPNAIEIVTEGKKYFFASFLSRDEAYRLIVEGLSQYNTNGKALLDHQESKSDASSPDNGLVLFEKVKSLRQPTNDLDFSDRNTNGYVSEKFKSFSNNEDETSMSMKLLEASKNGEGEQPDCSSRGSPLTWKLEDTDAPETPGHYTIVAESKFQIRVEEFFGLFFSDDAVNFIEGFHKKCGDKDFQCTRWYEHEQFGYARDVSFQHPIKIYLGAKFGRCHEVQKFRVYRNSHLVIEASQEINGVPYGDHFRVEGLWDVEQDGNEGNGGCILRVYINVSFLKKTMWKGKIEQSTIEECREAYAIWISNAHELLKQKQTPPTLEGNTGDFTNAVHNKDIGLKSITELNEPSARIRNKTSDSKDIASDIGDPLKGDFNTVTSMASILRESWTEFCVYIKSQNHFPWMLLITFVSILLLTQLCILLLLVRPQKVNLISEGSFMSGLGSDRAEATVWLEKRVHHLKDEMLMVETRLDKIHQEYALLKSHLHSLERFRPES